MTDETTLVIFGASGDLTSRLLLPALGQLLELEPQRAVRLVGAGMEDWSDEKWKKVVRTAFESGGADADVARRVHAEYVQADITKTADLTGIL
jgi:glucose-6-phosphate 1-dehydrogenase